MVAWATTAPTVSRMILVGLGWPSQTLGTNASVMIGYRHTGLCIKPEVLDDICLQDGVFARVAPTCLKDEKHDYSNPSFINAIVINRPRPIEAMPTYFLNKITNDRGQDDRTYMLLHKDY